MKKYLLRTFALVCVLLLTFSLCGCSILERFGITLPDLPFLQKADKAENSEHSQFVLSGPTDFYAEPSWDSQLLATYYAGYTVTYSTMVTLNGVTWAQAEEGWFAIDGSKPNEILESFSVDQDGIITEALPLYAEPSSSSEIYGQLDAGVLVHLSQIVTTADGSWGHISQGWIQLESYFSMEDLQNQVGFGVIRDNDACFYPEPNIYSGVAGTPACGDRYGILAVVEISGLTWAYTEAGWITTDEIYQEGTVGNRPCSAIVIDPTPLNVRKAPGTDKEILTTLTYGDHVNILERINYNGSDWGFTGTGWIFMDLTEIQ